MCLIIHKPAGVRIAHDLLRAAARLNADGWGVMGHDAQGRLRIERHPYLDLDALLDAEAQLADAEIALHLRRRTRGRVDLGNTHPFEIGGERYLMHNGTLRFDPEQSGHSDTRHFAEQVLRPLSQRHPGLLADTAFLRLLESSLTPQNKLVLYDHASRHFEFLNHAHGAVFEGLWLSSIKWIDAARLPLTGAPGLQQRAYEPREVGFL